MNFWEALAADVFQSCQEESIKIKIVINLKVVQFWNKISRLNLMRNSINFRSYSFRGKYLCYDKLDFKLS